MSNELNINEKEALNIISSNSTTDFLSNDDQTQSSVSDGLLSDANSKINNSLTTPTLKTKEIKPSSTDSSIKKLFNDNSTTPQTPKANPNSGTNIEKKVAEVVKLKDRIIAMQTKIKMNISHSNELSQLEKKKAKCMTTIRDLRSKIEHDRWFIGKKIS
jgi:hypothetical protein